MDITDSHSDKQAGLGFKWSHAKETPQRRNANCTKGQRSALRISVPQATDGSGWFSQQ